MSLMTDKAPPRRKSHRVDICDLTQDERSALPPAHAPLFETASVSSAPSPIRMTPLISPPSCTSSRFAAMSPCTTLVDWISTRSSARMLPRTSPPMIASREITSPSTSPPFPTSTWRPARTVPTTAPSIFTTPSAVMSPTTRMPVPMMDSPASVSGTPCPFSVKIAMSILLFHDGEGIERFALATDFEVEVRRRGSSRAAREGDHLSRRHRVAFLHEQAGGRSEEHTSELQSRGHLVCRLLLEKKKNT